MTSSLQGVENRFVTDTDWNGYLRYLDAIGDGRVRVTYDGTMLELITPSHRHERLKALLGSLLECLMDEWDIDFEPGGQTTFKQALEKKGLEADECYWVASWRQVLSGWDPETGPPPDLAIEVEVTRSVLDRISIYAALGIPELWRVSEQGGITISCLVEDGYRASESSLSFPGLPLALLTEHLRQSGEQPVSRILKSFRQALREMPPR